MQPHLLLREVFFFPTLILDILRASDVYFGEVTGVIMNSNVMLYISFSDEKEKVGMLHKCFKSNICILEIFIEEVKITFHIRNLLVTFYLLKK